MIALLTADILACPDPCLTPLIPVDAGAVVAMSSLIAPGAPMRNLVDRVNADPSRSGELGRRLGLIGSQTVADTLRRRLGGARVAERINVYDADGRPVGDFDAVAVDPSNGDIAVFEVLWEIGPDGSAQVGRTQGKANAKRDQVRKLRAAIANGATVAWPHDWEIPSEARYHWFILTPNVLPIVPLDDDGIVVRSHQMLARMLRPGWSVADTVRLLRVPAPPPFGERTTWYSLHYGPYDLRIEYVAAS